jgi:chromosome segregation ATPase
MDQEGLAPLIEFIGQKFDEVDRRLDQLATRNELEAKLQEARRHMGVLVEAVQDDIRQMAEGLTETNQRLDRFEQKVETEFIETRAAIRFSYAHLERRLQELESNYASLKERVERVEARQG